MLCSNRRLFCHSCSINSIIYKRCKSTVHFSSSGKVSDCKFPLSSSIHLALLGNPNYAIIKKKDVDEVSFLAGAKVAVEVISKRLSRRDIGGLHSMVSSQCLDDIRKNILEVLPMEHFPDLPVQTKDIFLQFIHSSEVIDKDKVRISTVTYSVPGLDKAEHVWTEYRKLKTTIYEHASRNDDGILKKGDVNAAYMRKKLQEYDDFQLSKVLEDNEIVATYYTFEKSGNSDWKVVSFSHTDTSKIWSRFRRFYWKGRLTACYNESMELKTFLRYEYIILTLSFLFAFYLQYLAIQLGGQYDEQVAESHIMDEQVAKASSRIKDI